MLFTTPPSVTNCHTFSDPLPLERDVLYGRPLRNVYDAVIKIQNWKISYIGKIVIVLSFLSTFFQTVVRRPREIYISKI